jgi:hypothetical protein
MDIVCTKCGQTFHSPKGLSNHVTKQRVPCFMKNCSFTLNNAPPHFGQNPQTDNLCEGISDTNEPINDIEEVVEEYNNVGEEIFGNTEVPEPTKRITDYEVDKMSFARRREEILLETVERFNDEFGEVGGNRDEDDDDDGFDEDGCGIPDGQNDVGTGETVHGVDGGLGSDVMLKKHLSYVRRQVEGRLPLTRLERAALRLMAVLEESNVQLHIYDDVRDWLSAETAGSFTDGDECAINFAVEGSLPTRKSLTDRMMARYDLQDLLPTERKCYLPGSKRVV